MLYMNFEEDLREIKRSYDILATVSRGGRGTNDWFYYQFGDAGIQEIYLPGTYQLPIVHMPLLHILYNIF